MHFSYAQEAKNALQYNGVNQYLNSTDSAILSRVNSSTIKYLCADGGQKVIDVVKGPNSIGSQLEAEGWKSTPSNVNPAPGTSGFFYAGPNTYRHSSFFDGKIDATHIENWYGFIRNSSNIGPYSNALAKSMLKFMEAFYGFELENCKPKNVFVGEVKNIVENFDKIGIYPNPILRS